MAILLRSPRDQFTYYIMFKPVTAKDDDAIWVPVAKAMVLEGHSNPTTGQYLEARSTQAENGTKRHDGDHRFPDLCPSKRHRKAPSKVHASHRHGEANTLPTALAISLWNTRALADCSR